ncbi:uncharacterized protein DUF4224 [Paraburkholderia sp. BL6665CI2N2]|uniref:DUF4224 domain-containing protein n=1 Tax=Paraburkholderia sp. BL6665CI2N2 TaxID=1938806 RepID=UPI00106657A1|nr:DUF4224 domain-containing protein [Paraburkholderia sp. BL6665CI2N2]TDY21514.1 uncharacterized protein DUF4224 [Paraburkholderia sp. BL6665CI2N2]
MIDHLTAQELADLVGCKPNRRATMKTWLENSTRPVVPDKNAMPKVLRLYRDRKLGISDDSQSTIDSRAASGPVLDAFKGKGPRSGALQSGSTSSFIN